MLRQLICCFLAFTSPVLAKTYTLGGDRPATLQTPKSISTDKIPLIVFLHGYTSSAAANDSFLGISRQKDALGFAIILPNGTKNSKGSQFWNATPECCDIENSGVDDASYLASLIREAETLAPIDSSRVYLIGHSNGGFMSYRMACEYPELIRGIISIAGGFFKDQTLCKKPGHLNVLQIHGTADTTIPPLGSDSFPAVQLGLDYWARFGKCKAAVSTNGALDLVTAQGNETNTTVWNGCTDNTRVGYWSIQGTGHLPYFNPSWLAEALTFVE